MREGKAEQNLSGEQLFCVSAESHPNFGFGASVPVIV